MKMDNKVFSSVLWDYEGSSGIQTGSWTPGKETLEKIIHTPFKISSDFIYTILELDQVKKSLKQEKIKMSPKKFTV